MSLTAVWLQTQGDGLVRADQVVGIDVHQTPALTARRRTGCSATSETSG